MEIKEIKCYTIEPEPDREITDAFFFTNATKEEFKGLVDNFISENESKGIKDFLLPMFMKYVINSGYYLMVNKNDTRRPYSF
ncbi:MAG: hypothetical protein B655_1306 [Methanobacterium sp. Maddingley MBC34]|nr:MAG: hypothetical protein B655_1306 [Methanobacterium sp. Maddingley MBC34]